MDLSIIVEANGEKNGLIHHAVKRAYDLGYECIAINTVIQSAVLSAKSSSVPEPKLINFEGQPNRKFRIVNRLTAVLEDNIHSHHLLRSPNTKKYDIIAVQPVGEKMLQHVCSTLDIDIICLNLAEDLGFSLKRTYIGQAIQKGICFEILYTPCLRGQSSKRLTISNSQLLVDVSKAKNIIISSGALNPLELRAPEDIANLALLFGFKPNQAMSAVRRNGQIVLSHAGTRNNTGCGFVSITGIHKLPKQQGWIIKACKVPKLSTSESSLEGTRKRKIEEISDADSKSKNFKPSDGSS